MTRKASLAVVVVAALVAVSVAAVGAVATTGSTPTATDSTVAIQDNETNATGNDTNETMGNDTQAANATANVTFVDQSSNGSAVYVNNTSLPEGGFVVIHVAENETFGAVIGNSSYLEPGAHENVTIVLDPPINESQQLIAMPHRDTNANETYDFPAADDPYVANGSPVTDDAFVVVEQSVGNATNETTGNESMNATNATGNSSVGA